MGIIEDARLTQLVQLRQMNITSNFSANMDACFNLNSGFFTQMAQDITLTQTSVTDQELLGIPMGAFKSEFNNISTENTVAAEPQNARFICASKEQIIEVKANRIPASTRRNTEWGVKTYYAWANFRNSKAETSLDLNAPVPVDLATVDYAKMNYWLSHFVFEVRKTSGETYPPRTLYNLVASIQRHYKEERDRPDMCFLDDKDMTFKPVRDMLDAVMKDLHAKGENNSQQTDPVTTEDEEMLWQAGVVGTHSSKALSNAVFLYNGKIFGIRGGEHRHVLREQYKIIDGVNGEYIEFTERKAKNRQGGLKDRKATPRTAQHYAIPNAKNCVVEIFKQYFALIPSEGPLYRRPITAKEGECKFSKQHIGANTLNVYLKSMFNAANINTEGRKISNHSLRVGLVTAMQDTGYDNFDIKSRSGHRSNTLDVYKRQTVKRKQEISRQLDLPHTVSKVPADLTESDGAGSMTHANKQAKMQAIDTPVPKEITDQKKAILPAQVEDKTLMLTIPSVIEKVVLKRGMKETVVLM